jgi:hypothetical protein
MNHVTVLLLSLLAFSALALAMDRHQRNMFGHRLAIGRTRCLRLGGWTALVLALLAAVGDQGWALGLVSYSGHTSLAAGLIFGALIANERKKSARS